MLTSADKDVAMRLFFGLLLVIAAAACDSTKPGARAFLALGASRGQVPAGDTLTLLGIAYNPGGATIVAGDACTPGVGFRAVGPDNHDVSLYDGANLPCTPEDSNQILPGETDSVSFIWHTPTVPGSYAVRAVVLAPDGTETPPITIILQP
jgi:hypothetical protein